MKWSEYRPVWKKAAEALGKPRQVGWKQAIQVMLEQFDSTECSKIWSLQRQRNIKFAMSSEEVWMDHGRPYYDMYPSIIEPFLRVDLDKVKGGHLYLPENVILVRLPIGCEIKSPSLCTGSFLVSFGTTEKGCRIGICAVLPNSSLIFSMSIGKDSSVSEELKDFTGEDVDRVEREDFRCVSVKMLKIVCSLSLIRNNPDIIEPLPLDNDLRKFEKSTDFERKALLEKAKRRGKVGWAVGKRIETVAGVRCPHFAIRWMGHGEPKTPVLRPISGCIVNRRKLSEIPTGYLDELEETHGQSIH